MARSGVRRTKAGQAGPAMQEGLGGAGVRGEGRGGLSEPRASWPRIHAALGAPHTAGTVPSCTT